jgi:hypothetical protein
MKKIFFILLGWIIVLNVSAQSTKRAMTLSGSIADRYPISMTLTFDGESILGFYFYDKYKTKILLEGQIQGNKIILNESPDYDVNFKMGFIGEFNNDQFDGVWTDKYRNKTLAFKTSVVSDSLTIIEEKIIDIEGYYASKSNSDDYIGTVDLKHIIDDLFSFEISNGTAGCTGYLKGLVQLTDLKKGNYTGNLCAKLDFSIFTDELVIRENNCDFHGMQCPFEGSYRKNIPL